VNTVRVRLLAAFFFIIALVIVIISLALLVLLRNSSVIERPAQIRLNEAMRNVFRQERPARNMSAGEATRYVADLASTYEVRALIADTTGQIIADSLSSGSALDLNLRAARENVALPNTRTGRARDGSSRPWLYVARPLATKSDLLLILALQQPQFPALSFFMEDLLGPLLQAGAVAAIVALVLALLISRSIAGPLQKMAGVAHGVAHGDYSQSAPVSGPDEVRALGRSINQMAKQVQASQSAQRDFVANVSHDLKTPLTSIQGFAQAIQDGAADSPEMVQRSAAIIYAEADRMRRLVEGLLTLERLDAGLKALHRAPLDLRLLLSTSVEKLNLRAQEKPVALAADLPPQLPALVGDADRLAQVFTNLIDNALKHTPAGGTIQVSAAATDSGVEVVVKDTGAGIPAEDLSRIFERFYQVDKSRARSRGVGLGLAISKEIVEAHGGSISVESVVGLGSKFTVRLPLALPEDSTVVRRRK
jgi:signal transduction histidine kinase